MTVLSAEYVPHAEDGTLSIEGAARLFGDPRVVGDLVADFGDGLLCLLTGVNRGPVIISARAWPDDPGPAGDVEQWEEICEVSVEADGSGLSGLVVMGGEDPRPNGEISFDQAGPGWYRMRVSARGRSREYDQVVEEPVEHYQIEAWPQDPGPDVVVKTRPRQG